MISSTNIFIIAFKDTVGWTATSWAQEETDELNGVLPLAYTKWIASHLKVVQPLTWKESLTGIRTWMSNYNDKSL